MCGARGDVIFPPHTHSKVHKTHSSCLKCESRVLQMIIEEESSDGIVFTDRTNRRRIFGNDVLTVPRSHGRPTIGARVDTDTPVILESDDGGGGGGDTRLLDVWLNMQWQTEEGQMFQKRCSLGSLGTLNTHLPLVAVKGDVRFASVSVFRNFAAVSLMRRAFALPLDVLQTLLQSYYGLDSGTGGL